MNGGTQSTSPAAGRTVQDWWHGMFNDERKLRRSAVEYVTAIESCLDSDVQRDLNQLDSRGTTALHEAVKLTAKSSAAARNAAIEALLRCGADVNVTDSHGKTALAYFPTAEIDQVCVVYFLVRINVLAYLDLPICEQNRQWYRQWHENIYGAWQYSCDGANANNDAFVDGIKKYAFYSMVVREVRHEIAALAVTRLNDRLTLRQVLNGASDEQIVCQLDDLQSVVKSDDFYDKFIDFGGLIKQRYRKALLTRNARRKKLKRRVVRAVEILFELPDLCNELIVAYLSYNDFLSLLEAFRFDNDIYEQTPDCEDAADTDSVFEAIGRLLFCEL